MTRKPSGLLDAPLAVREVENLVFVLGDQLDPQLPQRLHLDPRQDAVLMVEAEQEAEHVPSHRQRTTLFLSAMRSYALRLKSDGLPVRYVKLDDPANTQSLGTELERAASQLKPAGITVVQPGEHRVEGMIRSAARRRKVPLNIVSDETFTCGLDEFTRWAEGRNALTMEYFYRTRRKDLGILVTDGHPVGGSWNFDADNRRAFKQAPDPPLPHQPHPDAVTREVMALVERTFPHAPGRMKDFRWPVDPVEAERALERFIRERLPRFGTFEDAMWAGETFLFHSALSPLLNLKLLDPMRCVEAAVEAYQRGAAELNNVEGFVRQIIGWREFIRGVYFREGEDYPRRNRLRQQGNLPQFFWTGETDMNCLRLCLNDVLEHGYSHHIPRLMVIGNFTLIARVNPAAVHAWFLAMYVDAVEWVTAPNVVGMSQHADGGIVGTKPYAASGKYIHRMSNFCSSCRYDVNSRTGEDACPYNTLYWDFLIGHERRLKKNRRMAVIYRNVDRLSGSDKKEIRTRARLLRRRFGVVPS